MLEILYRDEHLVAIHKPSGLLVHRSIIAAHDEHFAVQLLRDQLGRRVYPLHRLDRGTSGVLLFAFDAHIAALVGAQFAQHSTVRRYVAVVRGHPPASGCVDHALQRRLDPIELRAKETGERRGQVAADAAQAAVTHFRRLATTELPWQVDRYPSSRYALLELTPESGRRHQLRRHMKHLSHPIIGDATYGKGRHNRMFAEHFGCQRLLLACTELRLRHPASGAALHIGAALAADFAQVVDALGWRAALCAAPTTAAAAG